MTAVQVSPDYAAFRRWLCDELRDAGCELRTLSPEGMAEVTIRRMAEQGWKVETPPQLRTLPSADRIAQAIGDPGSVVGRILADETVGRWVTRAVLAVLTEAQEAK